MPRGKPNFRILILLLAKLLYNPQLTHTTKDLVWIRFILTSRTSLSLLITKSIFIASLSLTPLTALTEITEDMLTHDGKGNYSYTSSGDLVVKDEISNYCSGVGMCIDRQNVSISTDGKLNFENVEFSSLLSEHDASYGLYPFDFTLKASEINFIGTNKPINITDNSNAFLSTQGSGNIIGDLNLQNAGLGVLGGSLALGDYVFKGNGYLHIQGNMNLNNSFVGVHGGKIYTTGTTTIAGTTFALYDENSYGFAHLLDSAGGIDLGSNNDVKISVIQDIGRYVDENSVINCLASMEQSYCASVAADTLTDRLFTYDFKIDNGALYAIGKVTEQVKQMSLDHVKKYAELEILETFKTYADSQAQCYSDPSQCSIENENDPNTPTREQIIQAYEELSQSLQDRIDSYTKDLYGDSAVSGDSTQRDFIQGGSIAQAASSSADLQTQILTSLKNSSLQSSAVDYLADFVYYDGAKIAKLTQEIESSARESMHTASDMAHTLMLTNDMSITTRLAKWSNPYKDLMYAQALASMRLADSSSTLNPAYLTRYNYDNNLWLNVFGGANIIGGKSGGVYGLSAGYDAKVGESTILGGYLSYAWAQINGVNLSQNAQNIQAGIYTRSTIGRSEIDANVRYQAGLIDQRNMGNAADYTNSFVGANLEYGYVFGTGSVLVKPLAGVNVYYFYTPRYTERGALPVSVRSNSDVNVSVSVGADVRKYFSNGSFLYILPKIEQYVMSGENLYSASFVGSNTSFVIAGDERLKTYGSVLVGGDIVIRESLSLNVGAGVKQSLAGSEHNITYISGNLGVKYRF